MSIKRNLVPSFSDCRSDDVRLFRAKIIEAAKTLRACMDTVYPSKEFVDYWDALVKEWSVCKDLPLYVRKTNENYPRGKVITHKTGRKLIPTDNGPANWSMCMCANGNLVTIEDVKQLIADDQIPVAMVLKGKEKYSDYKCTRNTIDETLKKGWKIAHVEAVGLKTRRPLEEISIEALEEHFRKFLSPGNIFLFPKEYSGLAEVKEVINVFKRVA